MLSRFNALMLEGKNVLWILAVERQKGNARVRSASAKRRLTSAVHPRRREAFASASHRQRAILWLTKAGGSDMVSPTITGWGSSPVVLGGVPMNFLGSGLEVLVYVRAQAREFVPRCESSAALDFCFRFPANCVTPDQSGGDIALGSGGSRAIQLGLRLTF